MHHAKRAEAENRRPHRRADVLTAAISDCQLLPFYSAPKDRLFTFRYKVDVTNRGTSPIELTRRYWEIEDDGAVIHVDAISVGGEVLPRINPGRSYSYVTAVPFHSPGGMIRGRFHAKEIGGDDLVTDVQPLAFQADGRAVLESNTNRALAAEFVASATPSELLSIQTHLSLYVHDCLNSSKLVEFRTNELSISTKTKIYFERMLLRLFFGEYEKLDKDGNTQPTLTLSAFYQHFPNIAISDIFMLQDGKDFNITISHSASVSRLLSRRLVNQGQNEKVVERLFETQDKSLYQILDGLLGLRGVPLRSRASIIAGFNLAIDQVLERERAADGITVAKSSTRMSQQKEGDEPNDEELPKNWTAPLLPTGLEWPKNRFENSPEFRKRGGLIRYLDRVWRPLIEAGYGERRIAKRIDPTVISGIQSFTKKDKKTGMQRVIPAPLRLLSIKEARERRMATDPASVLRDPKAVHAIARQLSKLEP